MSLDLLATHFHGHKIDLTYCEVLCIMAMPKKSLIQYMFLLLTRFGTGALRQDKYYTCIKPSKYTPSPYQHHVILYHVFLLLWYKYIKHKSETVLTLIHRNGTNQSKNCDEISFCKIIFMPQKYLTNFSRWYWLFSIYVWMKRHVFFIFVIVMLLYLFAWIVSKFDSPYRQFHALNFT